MRINKLLSNYGICSRKETNKLIEENRIKVNGGLCVLGQWVEESDEILIDDQPISRREKVYIAVNKPVGITCTAECKVKNNLIDFMNYPEYIFPVGRLDKESQGLIIMTNDGELANLILECDNMHEKEYVVEVDKNFDEEFIKLLSKGVEISGNESSGIKRISDTLGVHKNEITKGVPLTKDEINKLNTIKLSSINNNMDKRNVVKTRPCKVSMINDTSFRIILTQGLNKQIRKMCGALGYKVIKLERVRIMNLKIDNIEIGKWRYLNLEEITYLKREARLD